MNRYAFSLPSRPFGHGAARLGRRAFSLLELMIVVAIIVILVSLTLAVITPVLLKNEERVTKNVLAQLDAAVVEFETSVQRRVTFPNSNAEGSAAGTVWDIPFTPTFPVAPAAPFNNVTLNQTRYVRTSKLLELLGQESKARDILAKIPTTNFGNIKKATNPPEYMDAKGVVDAWGTPIVAVFPGREWRPTDPASLLKDFDGTIRSASEDGTTPATSGWGICRNKMILFVSAGPDLSFYDVTGTSDDERKDNIYSYEPEGK